MLLPVRPGDPARRAVDAGLAGGGRRLRSKEEDLSDDRPGELLRGGVAGVLPPAHPPPVDKAEPVRPAERVRPANAESVLIVLPGE